MEIARKAKIRRMKQKSGAHMKKKRIGTAAGGYSFVVDPGSSSKTGSGGSGKNVQYKDKDNEFNPKANVSSTQNFSKLGQFKPQLEENKPFVPPPTGAVKNPGVQASPLTKPQAPMATAHQQVHPDLKPKKPKLMKVDSGTKHPFKLDR